MKNTRFEGVGYTTLPPGVTVDPANEIEAPDDMESDAVLPALAFTIEMRDGPDYDGKMQYQWSAVHREAEDEVYLAFVTPSSGQPLVELAYDDAVRDFLDDVIAAGQYVALIDYENIAWEDDHSYTDVIFATPGPYDHWEHHEFEEGNISALKEIRSVLDRESVATE